MKQWKSACSVFALVLIAVALIWLLVEYGIIGGHTARARSIVREAGLPSIPSFTACQYAYFDGGGSLDERGGFAYHLTGEPSQLMLWFKSDAVSSREWQDEPIAPHVQRALLYLAYEEQGPKSYFVSTLRGDRRNPDFASTIIAVDPDFRHVWIIGY